MDEAPTHPLHKEREFFLKNGQSGRWEPQPAPKLSRTPGKIIPEKCKDPEIGEHSVEVLKEFGFKVDEIEQLLKEGVVGVHDNSSKL